MWKFVCIGGMIIASIIVGCQTLVLAPASPITGLQLGQSEPEETLSPQNQMVSGPNSVTERDIRVKFYPKSKALEGSYRLETASDVVANSLRETSDSISAVEKFYRSSFKVASSTRSVHEGVETLIILGTATGMDQITITASAGSNGTTNILISCKFNKP